MFPELVNSQIVKIYRNTLRFGYHVYCARQWLVYDTLSHFPKFQFSIKLQHYTQGMKVKIWWNGENARVKVSSHDLGCQMKWSWYIFWLTIVHFLWYATQFPIIRPLKKLEISSHFSVELVWSLWYSSHKWKMLI